MRDNRFKRWLGCFVLLAVAVVQDAAGAGLTQAAALARMDTWRETHPLMQVTLERPIAAVQVLPETAAAEEFRLYAVSFESGGYAIVNGDDLLPPVVAFAADSNLRLDDEPQNALRAILLGHVAAIRLQLAEGTLTSPPPQKASRHLPRQPLGGTTVQYGPWLFTNWNQTHPYNLLCPPAPGVGYGYNGKAPTGCVPLAFAQVMRYHDWPPYGKGSHSYYDTTGDLQGYHEADFTEPFLWDEMQNSYSYSYTGPQPGEDAVASAVYRLAVANEVDFESIGTGASIQQFSNRVGNFFYFEKPTYYPDSETLFDVLEGELVAGRPVVLAMPGHAVVADGILFDQGSVTYHINYGWGGVNNGWYDGSTPGDAAFQYGSAPILPALTPLPQVSDVSVQAGESTTTINWHLPSRRVDEIASLLVKRQEVQHSLWNSAAENFNHAVSSGWSVSSGGRTGNCWYAGPNGEAYLTLTDEFEPVLNTVLSFYIKPQVYLNGFYCQVSTDQGKTFTTIYQAIDSFKHVWEKVQIDLGPYAGSRIMLRFYLGRGSYYINGGVWLDDLSLNSGTWHRWEDYAEISLPEFSPLQPVALDLPLPGEHLFAAKAKDHTGRQHTLGAPFRLTVESDFLYRIEPDGSATITGCSLTEEQVVIPSSFNGHSVGSLAANSFTNSSLVSLIVPSSVTSIEADAFAGASALQRLLFRGNAPIIPAWLLTGSSTTVYYLPGTSGWSGTFGGRPALLWNPAFAGCRPDTPVPGSLRLDINGTATIPLRIETSDDLGPAEWSKLSDVTVGAGGEVSVSDPAAGMAPQQFYRIVFP